MGRELAATMMNLVPPAGWGDIVTRRDLLGVGARIDVLDSSLNARIDALDSSLNARIDTLAARLDARTDALDSSVNARIDTLESRLDARLETHRSEMLRTFGTWLFASQAAVIAAVSVLVALG